MIVLKENARCKLTRSHPTGTIILKTFIVSVDTEAITYLEYSKQNIAVVDVRLRTTFICFRCCAGNALFKYSAIRPLFAPLICGNPKRHRRWNFGPIRSATSCTCSSTLLPNGTMSALGFSSLSIEMKISSIIRRKNGWSDGLCVPL